MATVDINDFKKGKENNHKEKNDQNSTSTIEFFSSNRPLHSTSSSAAAVARLLALEA